MDPPSRNHMITVPNWRPASAQPSREGSAAVGRSRPEDNAISEVPPSTATKPVNTPGSVIGELTPHAGWSAWSVRSPDRGFHAADGRRRGPPSLTVGARAGLPKRDLRTRVNQPSRWYNSWSAASVGPAG